jgi:hypothetical protein
VILDRALEKELLSERRKEERIERLTELEDRIFERCSQVVEAVASFTEISEVDPEPPADWVETYGEVGAKQRLAVAKMGHLPANLMPVGIKVAMAVMSATTKGRAFRGRLTQNQLNVKLVLPAPTSSQHPGGDEYATRELEE